MTSLLCVCSSETFHSASTESQFCWHLTFYHPFPFSETLKYWFALLYSLFADIKSYSGGCSGRIWADCIHHLTWPLATNKPHKLFLSLCSTLAYFCSCSLSFVVLLKVGSAGLCLPQPPPLRPPANQYLQDASFTCRKLGSWVFPT